MEKSTFKVFNIESPVSQLVKIDQEFEQIRSFEDWDDTEAWMSKEVFHYDMEDDPKDNFDYRYIIEAYYCEEENKTYYYLYLVPCYNSLSDKMKAKVLDSAGIDPEDITERDVFDYGCQLVFAREEQEGEYDPEVMNKIASVYKVIDRMRGFYFDQYQNRIGNTGWDMLDYYMKDEDFMQKAFDRFDSSK
jgi:hypothetical protein